MISTFQFGHKPGNV